MRYRLQRDWRGWGALATVAAAVAAALGGAVPATAKKSPPRHPASAKKSAPKGRKKTPAPRETRGTKVVIPMPRPTDRFPVSVAVSSDGDTVVVGQPGNFVNESGATPSVATKAGSAYVFVRASHKARWRQQAVLTAPAGNVAGNGFGQAVAVSRHGDEIAIGAPGTTVGGVSNAGSVYVFGRPAAGWSTSSTPTATLSPSDPADGRSTGNAVAISGSTVVAGSVRGEPVYVFQKNAGPWANATQTAELSAPRLPRRCSTGELNNFGGSLAVEGSAVAVGYASYPSARTCAPVGAAFVYARSASGWKNTRTPTASLKAKNPNTSGALGQSIAMKGGMLVAGAPGAVVNGLPNVGAVYLFQKAHSGWRNATETARLTISQTFEGNLLGNDVGLSGNNIVAGNSNCADGAAACPLVFHKLAGRWQDGTESGELVPPRKVQRPGGGPPVAAGGGVAVLASENGNVPVWIFPVANAEKISQVKRIGGA